MRNKPHSLVDSDDSLRENLNMFTTNEALFQTTNDLVDSLEQSGHGSDADVLKDRRALLSGFADG